MPHRYTNMPGKKGSECWKVKSGDFVVFGRFWYYFWCFYVFKFFVFLYLSSSLHFYYWYLVMGCDVLCLLPCHMIIAIYFISITLKLFHRTCIPNLEESISNGDFTPLRVFLNERIHHLGSLYPNGDELMIAVTGKPLDPQIYLLNYLRNKYTELYKL